jgi:hypothetical protein
VHDLPRAEIDQEERADGLKPDVIEVQEIARPRLVAMVPQERRPRLPARSATARLLHVLLDCGLGDTDSELEQLAADALGSPEPVLHGQPLDQPDGFSREPCGAGRSRFLAPEEAESFTVPTQEGLGLHEQESLAPSVGHPGSENGKLALVHGELWARGRARCDDQLLTQQEIFGQELRAGARGISEQPEHGVRWPSRRSHEHGDTTRGADRHITQASNQFVNHQRPCHPGTSRSSFRERLRDGRPK